MHVIIIIIVYQFFHQQSCPATSGAPRVPWWSILELGMVVSSTAGLVEDDFQL